MPKIAVGASGGNLVTATSNGSTASSANNKTADGGNCKDTRT